MADCILSLDLESPARNNDLLFTDEFFPQVIFLFLLRALLTDINICIAIIGKVALIFLNKCEAQVKVRKYLFIGMTQYTGLDISNSSVFYSTCSEYNNIVLLMCSENLKIRLCPISIWEPGKKK